MMSKSIRENVVKTSFRISMDLDRRLSELADKLHISKTAVLELAVRKMAQEEGIQ